LKKFHKWSKAGIESVYDKLLADVLLDINSKTTLTTYIEAD